MNSGISLETELERRATNDDDAKTFWECYQSAKGYLSRNYYPWIKDNCPFFTDHGAGHIESVIQAASLLLRRHLEPSRRSNLLNSLDIYLILSAILWHDVGNVLGRTGHAKSIAEMTKKVKELFPDIAIQRLVVEIAKAHSGENGLETPRSETDYSTPNKTCTLYPKALAAIVRFSDELSDNRSRISPPLIPTVPEDQRIFWEYANCISGSRADPARERVVITVEMDVSKAGNTFPCPEYGDRLSANGKISLIEYTICRLEKMNNERVYCAPEFRSYQTIREIVIRFTPFQELERIKEYEIDVIFQDSGISQRSYPKIPTFDDFFDKFPAWKPEALNKRFS